MGLSQQVAFSSLLAFFPSVILLVGLLGLIGAYDDLQSFLGTVAPGCGDRRDRPAQETAAGNKASVERRARDRHVRRGLGSERRDERDDQGRQPSPTTASRRAPSGRCGSRDRARLRDRAHARRPVPPDRVRRPARRGDREPRAPRRRLGLDLEHRALAARVLRRAALLRARLLPRAERRPAELEMGHAGLARRARCSGSRSRVSSRSTRASRARTRRRTARSRAGSSCCSG